MKIEDIPEPKDGSMLVIKEDFYDMPYLIWRNDKEAAHYFEGGDSHGQNWFRSLDSDPMTLRQHLKNAVVVFLVGSNKPYATRED